MNSNRNLLALAVSLTFAGSAAAQTGASPGAGDSPRGTASPAITAPAGGASPAAPVVSPAAAATHELKATRLSKLRGVNIYDNNAKKIGEVKDVVVDPASGRILHTIVSIGGVMGVGDKEHAVPTKQLRVFSRSAEDAVPVKVELSGGAPDSLPQAEKLDKDSPHLLGSKVAGMDIDDSGGKQVGEVEDLVLDLQAGEAKFALVDFDDALGGDDKLHAIPLADLQRSKESRNFALNISKDSLAQRPSIDEKRLDKMDLSTQPWMQAGGATGSGAASAATAAGSGGSTPAAGSAGSAGSTPAAGSAGSTPAAGSGGSTPAAGSDSGASKATGNRTPPSAGPGGTPPAGSAGSQPGSSK